MSREQLKGEKMKKSMLVVPIIFLFPNTDYVFGPRRTREGEITDEYFPCVVAMRLIGSSSIESLGDYALFTSSNMGRKLAISCLVRIKGKEESIKILKKMGPFGTADKFEECKKIIVEWEGNWIFENNPEKGKKMKEEKEG